MDKRVTSGRDIPSILKKPKGRRQGDLLDKSTKIKREKVQAPTSEDVSAPLPQGCTPLMYACQQADYKTAVDILNKDVSSTTAPRSLTHVLRVEQRTSAIIIYRSLVLEEKIDQCLAYILH